MSEILELTPSPFLKRRHNWNRTERRRMRSLEGRSLRTLRAFLLVEAFQHFWTYWSPTWAGKFLDGWCERVARSRLEPLKTVAKSLHKNRQLLLNYFRAKKEYSGGVIEGLNNKAKLTVRKSYGFRTDQAREVALFHALGRLPEPELTHEFF
jgi:transposase